MAADDVKIGITIDDESIAKLAKAISDAFAKGGDEGANRMQKRMGKTAKDIAEEFAKTFATSVRGAWAQFDAAATKSFKASKKLLGDMASDMGAKMRLNQRTYQEAVQKSLTPDMMRAILQSPVARKGFEALVEQPRASAWQTLGEYQTELKHLSRIAASEAAERRQIHEKEMFDRRTIAAKALTVEREMQKRITANERIELQMRAEAEKMQLKENLALTRAAAERRTVIIRTMARSIILIEQSIVKAVSGTAKLMVSTFQSAGNAITSIFRRSNNSVESDLRSSLGRRNSALHGSLRDQEQMISRSAARQSASLNAIRQQTSTGVMGAVTGRGAGMGIAALAGGVGIAAMMRDGYNEAVNLNEQINKTNVLFGDAAQSVIGFADTSVDRLGMTKAGALEAVGTFGNLLRSLKFTEDESAFLSGNLTLLAADLSSFNNVPVTDALDALRSGLVGETEPLKRFGVNLNEATLKAKALDLGLYNGKGTLDAYAKAQAAMALIVEQTGLANGDFFRTMDQGANATRRAGAALRQFMASIMGAFRPLITVVMNVAADAFQMLNSVISNDTNPALLLLKSALKGVAIGMGTILALKGVVEVFKLIGPAIQLALGPMGRLLIIAGAIGAVFNVMLERSASLRNAFGFLRDRLGQLGSKIADTFAPLREAAVGILDRYVIPAIDRTAAIIAVALLPAFDAIQRFVVDRMIPAFVEFGKFVGKAFDVVAERVVAMWRVVQPVVQPMIDGFAVLGEAVRRAFTGDFSQLGGGFIAAGEGIVTVFGTIVSKIGDLLAPLAARVVDFFAELFSPANLERYAIGFLKIVELVGRTLGTIVSSPVFIKAVLGIAAAAVIIAGAFVKGFAEGVIANLPEVWKMITDALILGLKAALKAMFGGVTNILITGLVALVAAAFGSRVLGAFRRGGEQAGTSFVGGLVQRAKITAIVAKSIFNPGVFKTIARDNAQAAGRELVMAFNQNNLLLRAAGEKTLRAGFMVTQKIATDAQTKVEQLRAKLGDLGFAALEAKAKMMQMQEATLGMGRAVMGFGANLRFAADAGKTHLQGLVMAFRLTLSDMKAAAAQQGTTVGQVLGASIRTAVSGALAAIGGFQAGMSAGQSGQGGLGMALTALTTGIGASAMSGGNPIIGAIAAGTTLIGGLMGQNKKAEQDFKQRLQNMASALDTILQPALDDGKVTAEEFYAALTNSGENRSTFNKAITDFLDPTTLGTLNEFGISAKDLQIAFAGGATEVDALVTRMQNMGGFGSPGFRAAMAVRGAFYAIETSIRDANNEAQFLDSGATGAFGRLRDTLNGVVNQARRVSTISSDLGLAGAEIIIEKVRTAREELDMRLSMPLPVPGVSDFDQAMNTAILDLSGFGSEIQTLINDAFKPDVNLQVNEAQIESEQVRVSNIISSTINQGIRDGSIKTKEDLQAAIDSLVEQATLGGGDGAEAMVTEWARQLGPGLAKNLQEKLDQAVEGKKPVFAAGGQALGEAIGSGISAGIDAKTVEAEQAANRLAGKIVKIAETTLGIASPSKVFREIGANLARGMADGIKTNTDMAVNAAAVMASAVTSASMVSMPGVNMPTVNPGGVMGMSGGSAGVSQSSSVSNKNVSIENNIYLPTGNPEAAALTVANRQASSLWL